MEPSLLEWLRPVEDPEMFISIVDLGLVYQADLEEVENNNGKCYIAVENDKAVGLIMGCIFPYDEYDYLR